MQAIKFASVFIHFIVLSLRRNCDFAKMCSLISKKTAIAGYVIKSHVWKMPPDKIPRPSQQKSMPESLRC